MSSISNDIASLQTSTLPESTPILAQMEEAQTTSISISAIPTLTPLSSQIASRASVTAAETTEPIQITFDPSIENEYERAAHFQHELDDHEVSTMPLGDMESVTMRVNQLDALELDRELHVILMQQLRRAFRYIAAERVNAWQPEMELGLAALLDAYTVACDAPTPGSALHNIVMRAEKAPKWYASLDIAHKQQQQIMLFPLSTSQKVMYVGATTVARYAHAKITHYMTMNSWGAFERGTWQRRIYEGMRVIERVLAVLKLANFVAFLYNGRYRTLVERVLQLRMVYLRSRVGRQISFEFMNQQLAWQTMAEFLMFIFPLINFDKIGAFFRSIFSFGQAGNERQLAGGCPVCSMWPIAIPYVSSCGCVFCYYCIKANKMANSHFKCPRCAHAITHFELWKADIHEQYISL